MIRCDPGAFAPRAVATPERTLDAALADELTSLTIMLSELAYELGSDPATLRRHISSLQMIDRITQMQTAIADILRSDDNIEGRLADIALEDLAERLHAQVVRKS